MKKNTVYLVCIALLTLSCAAGAQSEEDKQTLSEAIVNGDRQTVEQLLAQHPDLANAVIMYHTKSPSVSPLRLAIGQQKKEITELLLRHGADPCADPQPCSILQGASRAGYTDLIPRLIDKGLNPNASECEISHHPLVSAKDAQTAEVLLRCGAQVNFRDKHQRTPLHGMMCSYDRMKVVQYLLQQGADANAQDRGGNTPLHAAAWCNETDMVQLLLENGADLHVKNRSQQTPLEYALAHHISDHARPSAKPDFYQTLNLLISYGAPCTIDVAIRTGNLQQVQSMLQENHDLFNEKEFQKNPLLHCAIEEGHFEIVDFLIQQGADISQCNRFGIPALHAACCVGNSKIVALLLNAGADVNLKGRFGELALHWVSRNPDTKYAHFETDYPKITQMMLNAGSEINTPAQQQRPDMWLDMASDEPFDQVRCYLEEKEIRRRLVNVQTMMPPGFAFCVGDTPLHSAARWGRTEIVQILIDAGAAINCANHFDQTPLHYAVTYEHLPVIEILLKAGADPGKKMKEGKTALDIAEELNNESMTSLLKQYTKPREKSM